ncbi:hypothetical protein [Alteriqipengyuania lutimaris]|uniref:UrcA family protein n=1 Tax=Alteriqipengyuania lutimaris TaxID=1538146 RepID=A0A395LMF3_9SPHN|nr:hypothetical protein [Alteriqipengyuania lutimaris]MBB3032989.1 hypothetical protein [Alteriqipengyuania lutimaris]RDS77935.1 hypothetical protein DL238_10215 [Alteriqipengyuania lutimaris]
MFGFTAIAATVFAISPQAAIITDESTLVSEPAKAAIMAGVSQNLVCVDGPDAWNADIVCMTRAEWDEAARLAELQALAAQRDRAIGLAQFSSRRP